MENAQQKTRVTFKDVQLELEKEVAMALDGFKADKGGLDSGQVVGVLRGIGLHNSFTYRLLNDIRDSERLISYYAQKYPSSKFILHAQLERILGKYDLYLREMRHYIGEVPTKNIKDIIDFKVEGKDIVKESYIEGLACRCLDGDNVYSYPRVFMESWASVNGQAWWQYPGILMETPSNSFRNCLKIACVRELLHHDAFENSQDRIISGNAEIPASNFVEDDPIILCKVHGGWLVVTAWGPEASDEDIVNHKMN